MKNLLKYKIYQLAILFSFIVLPKTASAQVSLPTELRPEYLPDVTRGNTAEEKVYGVVGDVILTALEIVGGIAILFLIITGFKYVLAFGEEEKITKAKTTMYWIIGGLILLILSYSIIRFVIQLTLITEEI